MTNFLLCYYSTNFSIGVLLIRKKYNCIALCCRMCAPFSSLWGTMFCYCWTMNKRSNCRTVKLWKWIIWDQYKRKKELENQSMFENTLDWMPTHVLGLADPGFYLLFHFQNYFPEREAGQPWISTRLHKGGWALLTTLSCCVEYMLHVLSDNKC